MSTTEAVLASEIQPGDHVWIDGTLRHVTAIGHDVDKSGPVSIAHGEGTATLAPSRIVHRITGGEPSAEEHDALRLIEAAEGYRNRALANIAAVNRRIGERLTAQPDEPVMVDHEMVAELVGARATVRASWDVAVIVERGADAGPVATADALRRFAMRGLSQIHTPRSTSGTVNLIETAENDARVSFARALGILD